MSDDSESADRLLTNYRNLLTELSRIKEQLGFATQAGRIAAQELAEVTTERELLKASNAELLAACEAFAAHEDIANSASSLEINIAYGEMSKKIRAAISRATKEKQ